MEYKAVKTIDDRGAKLEMTVRFHLDDNCCNGVCDFKITGKIVCVKGKKGVCRKGDVIISGACHEEIAEHFLIREFFQYFQLFLSYTIPIA